MFMSLTRPRRDHAKTEDHAGTMLLQHVTDGMFVLDATDKVLEPLSESMRTLFGQRDLLHLSFAKMLQPIVSERTLIAVCDQIAHWRKSLTLADRIAMPLHLDIEVRIPQGEGSADTGHYAFDFFPLEHPEQPGVCLGRVIDKTATVRQARELDDLRKQLSTQAAILRSVLRMGRVRFMTAVQRTDAAMTAINSILKKPAREQSAFRNKLEETLEEVCRIRREGATLQLPSLEQAAREFENSLHDMRHHSTLSGGDFLPLALKLDELFSEFALLRSVTKTAGPVAPEGVDQSAVPVTQNGTQILEAPQFLAQMAAQAAAQSAYDPAPRSLPAAQTRAPAGSLEHTLQSLTEHVAGEHNKLVSLHCRGLQKIPPAYERTAKYVAIQMIRNAVVHGIEMPDERTAVGKPPTGLLHLLFIALPDGTFELRFQDDGRGIDARRVREVAVDKQLVDAAEAATMRDRQAIKLIFRGGFTTLTPSATEPALGTGLSLVRRYVSAAGGRIALASELGRETRFRITLPALAASAPADDEHGEHSDAAAEAKVA
jgi:signal transduction histidine kinase